MELDLKDIRVRLDQQAEKIISGLKDRSRYLLNEGVFTQEFHDRLSWFQYRLREEQNLDSEFGRYEFEDQHPILYKKEDLIAPRVKRTSQKKCLTPADIDMGCKIIQLYREILPKLCKKGEDPESYGEVAKLDVNNILCLYERICGIGPYVAESKIQDDVSLLHIVDPEIIRSKLVYPEREREVMDKGFKIAQRYELPDPNIAKHLFRKIIDLTLEVEVAYIQQVQMKRSDFKTSPWGNVQTKSQSNARGWGSQ